MFIFIHSIIISIFISRSISYQIICCCHRRFSAFFGKISVFINFDENSGADFGNGSSGPIDLNENLFKSIDELELSVRATNCLRSANISTVGELVQRSENDMLKTKNFGRKSLDEIKQHLLSMGLDFGMKIDNFDKKYQEYLKEKEQQNEA